MNQNIKILWLTVIALLLFLSIPLIFYGFFILTAERYGILWVFFPVLAFVMLIIGLCVINDIQVMRKRKTIRFL